MIYSLWSLACRYHLRVMIITLKSSRSTKKIQKLFIKHMTTVWTKSAFFIWTRIFEYLNLDTGIREPPNRTVFLNWDADIHGPPNPSVFQNWNAGINGPSNRSVFLNWETGIHGPPNRSVVLNWNAGDNLTDNLLFYHMHTRIPNDYFLQK